MKIKTLSLLLCLFLILLFSFCHDEKSQKVSSSKDTAFVAPTPSSAGLLKIDDRVCYFSDVDSAVKKMEIVLDSCDSREKEIVVSIMQYSGLPSNFDIYRGNIDNAMATMVNQHRLIIYNKNLFRVIDKLSDSYWSSIFIMAHEIGHHLAYNIMDTVHTKKAELDADMFAATILFKMGADTNQVRAAVNSSFISNEMDTRTHPSKSKRLAAILDSWKNASKLGTQMAVPPPPYDQGRPANIFKNELWDIPNEKIEGIDSPIKVSAHVSAIILKVDYNKYGRDATNNERSFQVLVLITGLKDSSQNEMNFMVNERRKLDVLYSPMGSDGEDPDYIFQYFCAGRRLQFTAYDYIDMIEENQRIVDVE